MFPINTGLLELPPEKDYGSVRKVVRLVQKMVEEKERATPVVKIFPVIFAVVVLNMLISQWPLSPRLSGHRARTVDLVSKDKSTRLATSPVVYDAVEHESGPLSRIDYGIGGPRATTKARVDYSMPERLDEQDCIKAGATCTIRVTGGYLKLTDITFPHDDSQPGSALADGVIKGTHVHGMLNVQGNQLPLGHFIPAREDAEPDVAAHNATVEQGGKQDAAGDPKLGEGGDLPGNASSTLQFWGGSVDGRRAITRITRTRDEIRRGGGLDSQYNKAVRTIVGNLRRQNEKVHVAEKQIADAVEQVITSHAVSSSIARQSTANVSSLRYLTFVLYCG